MSVAQPVMAAVPHVPDFELIRRIGGGSYGDVWLGRSVTGIYRAIKIVDRSRFADARPFLREFDGIRRFQKAVGGESTQLALLHVGFDEIAGLLYYVMELADDVRAGSDIDPKTYVPLTLKERRQQNGGRLPVADCVAIGAVLASALAGLHKAGLIHRDVKPSNIIFVGGVAKLADVGLVASTEQTVTSLGTPGYAPPEGGGTTQGDIYSLGKILYECVTGLKPDEFPRVPMELVSQPGQPNILELNEVVLRACDFAPTKRYATAEAMLQELRLLQAGRSVQELNRNRRRIRVFAQACVICALLSLVLLAALAVQHYAALEQRARTDEANTQLSEYKSDLVLAQMAYADGNLAGARAALRRALPKTGRPDLRGFEWWALWRETQGSAEKVGGQVGGPAISTVAVSPDNQWLVTQEGERPRATAIYNLATLERSAVADNTLGLSGFSADGKSVWIGAVDKHFYAWDRSARAREKDEAVLGRVLQQLPDRETFLLSQQQEKDSHLILWNSATHRAEYEWSPPAHREKLNLTAATVSADHQLLAACFYAEAGSDRQRSLWVWDVAKNAALFPALTDVDHVQWLRFSPDHRLLALAMQGAPIRIVSTDTGKTVRELAGHSGVVRVVEFSPDGKRLASAGSDGSIRIWNLDSDAAPLVMLGHEEDVVALTWLADSDRLVSGSRDGTWRLWSVAHSSPSPVVSQLRSDVLGTIVFTPDGQRVLATDDQGKVGVFDVKTMRRERTITGACFTLCFADDGKTLFALTRDRSLVSCDVETGEVQALGLILQTKQTLTAYAASRRLKRVAFGGDHGDLEIWDLAEKKLVQHETLPSHISALEWANDRNECVAADRYGKLWSSDRRRATWTDQNAVVYNVAFSPDDHVLAVGRSDGQITLEDAGTGQVLAVLTGHAASVSALTFSPDGARLVSGDGDGVVIFWDVRTRNQLAVWSKVAESKATFGPRAGIAQLKFDDSGNRLGAFTDDGQLRVWDGSKDLSQRD